jgi:hypothetical protein
MYLKLVSNLQWILFCKPSFTGNTIFRASYINVTSMLRILICMLASIRNMFWVSKFLSVVDCLIDKSGCFSSRPLRLHLNLGSKRSLLLRFYILHHLQCCIYRACRGLNKMHVFLRNFHSLFDLSRFRNTILNTEYLDFTIYFVFSWCYFYIGVHSCDVYFKCDRCF